MVYDENKTVILNIPAAYEFTTAGHLANYLMGKIFTPYEPVGDLPLRAHRLGGFNFQESEYTVFSFYRKNDPLLTYELEKGGVIIESDAPMSFKINKLTNEQKQADEFNNESYLDVYDALFELTDDRSDKFESLGYALPKVDNQQIVFHAMTAVNLPMAYPSIDVSLDSLPSISCDGANTYMVIEPLEYYDKSVYTGGTIKIVDVATQTGKSYYFNNLTEFFDSKWVRETIAVNHKSLIIEEVSGSTTYLIGLYGTTTPSGETINDTKIIITLDDPNVKLLATDNSSITGSGTSVISACLSTVNFNAK
jgi:hypothetical protein